VRRGSRFGGLGRCRSRVAIIQVAAVGEELVGAGLAARDGEGRGA